MQTEFSEQICRKLEEYETYVESCKSPMMHKEQVVVDREMLMSLLKELREFHSVNAFSDEEAELDFTSVVLSKEKILTNAAWKSKQMVDEAEVVRNTTLEEAINDAQREADRILTDAKAYDAKVKAEAENIVEVTLRERRQELETARKDLEDNREGILEEARQQSAKMIADTRQEAEDLKKQLADEVEQFRIEKEAEMKQRLIQAQEETQKILDEKTKAALEIYSKAVHDSEDMVNLIHGLYSQQIEVIQQDRKEILGIIDKLERKGLQRSQKR